MAITRVGGATAEATTITIPAGHQSGDLIVMFAYRDGSNTVGTIPAGWQKLEASGANTNSAIVACKWATSSSETSGTWTSATNLAVVVYRGAGGAGTLTTGTAASTSIAYNALNAMWSSAGTSWVVGFAGHRSTNTAITTAPTGMTNVAGANGATAGIAVHDTNGGVASWSTQTVAAGGTSSGWRSAVVAIFPAGTFGIIQRSENKAATATSLSVTPQITPTNGNLLVLVVGFANNVGTPGTPTGWTLIDAGSNASGAGLASYYKVAASETGGAYTVTGNGSSDSWSAALFEITGQNTTTPINQHSAQHLAASGTTYATPSVTPSALSTLALLTFTQDLDSATFTINGTTNVLSNVHPGSNHGLGVAMLSAPTADTVTALTQTWTGAASDTFTSAILIAKASGAGSQTVSPSAITSAETFGTATVTPGGVTVSPGGVASTEAFGTATVTRGAVTVSPGGIVSTEAFGAATVTLGPVTLSPTGIATGEAFGATTVSPGPVTVSPGGIATGEAFGTAVVTPGAVTVSPSGIASGQAFGAATVTPGPVTVTPAGIATGEAFGTVSVTPGPATVSPAGITSAETFGTAVVSAGGSILTPTGIASGEAFGTAVLTPGPVTVAPVGIATAASFGTAAVTPGAVILTLPAITSAEAFGSPSVTVAGQVISIPGYSSTSRGTVSGVVGSTGTTGGSTATPSTTGGTGTTLSTTSATEGT